ncbi:MAG: hypothetical protein IKQ13_06435 [Treponema sp.]|nr:hypothetical protein [Treponema sp.]MBR6143408.1 hypothetical protein [Treponema sp.]
MTEKIRISIRNLAGIGTPLVPRQRDERRLVREVWKARKKWQDVLFQKTFVEQGNLLQKNKKKYAQKKIIDF